MSRRCLICANLNPCREHSGAEQLAELRRNDAAIARIRAEQANAAPTAPRRTTMPNESGRRLDFTAPDGARIGISVPGGVDPDVLVAEFAAFQRAIAFGHARAIINFDGPPKGLRRRTTWALAVAVSRIAQWAKMAWSYSLGRAHAERSIREHTDAFRGALLKEPSDG